MYNRILIATDGSKLAEKAVDHGSRLAKSVGATILFVTVIQLMSDLDLKNSTEREVFDIHDKSSSSSSKKILADAEKHAASIGVNCEIKHVGSEYKPYKAILKAAKSEGCDLIVIASRGHRGVKKMLLGSQAQELISLSRIPVLVVR
ncbi:universal stress protein [Ovoidimarina sediminis]|uniref:universal stress protein n=1 Tax=Ovoidimarina sediminis TaxID=3079856 RepID=UPI00290DF233|nr:universal stress protein [Rhodophyticola sp. MJ-SS7]MDU8944296.1 universal stress protein [Rhodophyticola sp. MJ-SS7]